MFVIRRPPLDTTTCGLRSGFIIYGWCHLLCLTAGFGSLQLCAGRGYLPSGVVTRCPLVTREPTLCGLGYMPSGICQVTRRMVWLKMPAPHVLALSLATCHCMHQAVMPDCQAYFGRAEGAHARRSSRHLRLGSLADFASSFGCLHLAKCCRCDLHVFGMTGLRPWRMSTAVRSTMCRICSAGLSGVSMPQSPHNVVQWQHLCG